MEPSWVQKKKKREAILKLNIHITQKLGDTVVRGSSNLEHVIGINPVKNSSPN